MESPSVKACVRCHRKKIRCTGYPNCRNCGNANVPCEQYIRPRKSDSIKALNQAKQRVQWLEDELRSCFNIDCSTLPTGTSLASILGSASIARHHGISSPLDQRDEPIAEIRTVSADTPSHGGSENTLEAPDISLLALNATGEMKYLGPSSGSFFSAYATTIARSFITNRASSKEPPFDLTTGEASPPRIVEPRVLLPEDVSLLLKSYRMWVHPLYPLLNPDTLQELATRCCNRQATPDNTNSRPGECSEMAIFYLVMALGATNYSNTIRQMPSSIRQRDFLDTSPSSLYSKAMQYIDRDSRCLQPSISMIQIVLLISIYSSFGPVGSSQWQLAGIAMRVAIEIGLHCSARTWQVPQDQLDERNRAFWTAYQVEISLAYNLGRPPSIRDENITSNLPALNGDTAMGIYHIRHRQIQSKIVSQVYCDTKVAGRVSLDDAQRAIAKLQDELDIWRTGLPSVMAESEGRLAYPASYWERLYHGTSFVLHRSSPLCPHPSVESLERCIRSAATYIDCMADILRNSHVPLTWMLIQGILFAGLTMLVTARTGFQALARSAGVAFLLVDLPSWTRKCSICLAIMNERWSESLLLKLDSQFEALANDTLRSISSLLTQQTTGVTPHQISTVSNNTMDFGMQTQASIPRDELQSNVFSFNPANGPDEWENMQFFREFLGIDDVPTFWDVLPFDWDMASLPLSENDTSIIYPNTGDLR